MRSPDELAHLQGLDAVRDQFPVFNFNNSPRIIADAKAAAAKAAEASTTTNMPAGTNAPAAATGAGK